MYYTGIDLFTKEEVYVARNLRDRKLQRALLQFFKPENYFEVRKALEQAGRTDLMGGGCDALIPAQPPREAPQARRDNANTSVRGEYVHTVPNPKAPPFSRDPKGRRERKGYRPGRKSAPPPPPVTPLHEDTSMRHCLISCALLAALTGAARAEDKYDESLRRFQVKEHTNAVTAVAISPDGKTLATAGKDKSIRFFGLATGKRTNIIHHESEIWSIGYSGDGKSFAYSDGDKVVTVVDPETLKEKAVMKDQFESPVAMLSLSPDGSLLATIEDGLQVPHAWELPSGKARAVFEGHGDKVNSVAFSPDGKHVVSTSGDETIRIWEATAGIPGRPLRGHDGPVFLAVYSPDGKMILSAGTRDKTVRLWDLSTFKVAKVMEGHEDEVHFVGLGPNGMMASLSKDGVVKLWDADGAETGSFLWTGEGATLPPYGTSVALSPDGKTLAVGHDNVVDVWDLTKVKSEK